MRLTPTQRGSALVMTMFLILALMALGATFITVSVTDRDVAANEADATRAFELAEAGIEHARAELPTQNLNTLLAGGGHLFTNTAVGAGTYTVVVSNNTVANSLAAADPGGANDTDGLVYVASTGHFRKATRAAEVLLAVPHSDFTNVFWAKTKITISSSGYTDAYNSNAGAYNAGTATADGDIYAGGTITLSGSSLVKGDAATSTSTSPDATHVSGTVTVNAPVQTINAVSCPGSYTLAADVPAGSGVTYNAATGDLKVSGGNNVTLTVPPTSYYFSDVDLSGGSTMTLNNPGNVHVDIYVSGKFTVSGTGGVNNTTQKPTLLTLWACGAGTSDWTLSGGSGAYFAVHAPKRKVTLSGASALWGAIVADEINSSGGSAMHYDQALAGGNGNAARVQRSWRELFQ